MKRSELVKIIKEELKVVSEAAKGDFDQSLKLAVKMSKDAKALSVLYEKVASGLGGVSSDDEKQRKGVINTMFKAKDIIGSLETTHHKVFMDVDLPPHHRK